jgi:hypothetical protein
MTLLKANAPEIDAERDGWMSASVTQPVLRAQPDPDWQVALGRLSEWNSSPQCSVFEETDVPVTDLASRKASMMGKNLWFDGKPGPMFVSPDGSGGVSFEWRLESGRTKIVNVLATGEVEEIDLLDSREVGRRITV